MTYNYSTGDIARVQFIYFNRRSETDPYWRHHAHIPPTQVRWLRHGHRVPMANPPAGSGSPLSSCLMDQMGNMLNRDYPGWAFHSAEKPRDIHIHLRLPGYKARSVSIYIQKGPSRHVRAVQRLRVA
ncbi:hypothetical protein UA08_05967 [Talaromyces atroroseus]|uniref:Uncharacterized protein n=1 Tax=Talaromyces atroroseus TaxID=1441469 RepID=A0A225AX78_TALAT|nr:hypothetical protein UA08_05967 [Talaromyces atroroseus]OKL59055.1 hypothetical protein UA08_05967 [Talaromyces atroroseus]